MRITKVYTRTGDDGTTGLGKGERVMKNSYRIIAFGSLDELNAVLGVVLAEKVDEKIVHTLNASALAIPRVLAAILENNLQKNGDI